MRWKMGIDERTWLFINVHTMRVICSVKVKRKEDERVTEGGFFQVWLPGLSGNGPREWPKSWQLSWGSRILFRSANILQFRNGIPPWSSILGQKILDHRGRTSTILGERSRAELKRLAEEIKEETLDKDFIRCFVHQSWWSLIRCLISASGWRVRRGPLQTSGSAGSGGI